MKRLVWSALLFALAGTTLFGAEEAKDKVDARRLFQALRDDSIVFLEKNLERLPDANIRDKDGNTLIHALIAPGQVMPPDPPPVSPPPSSRRVVHGVDKNGQRFTIVQGVGEYGTISAPHATRVAPRNIASARADDSLPRRMALIRQLVARGVLINSVNAKGQTPLHLAVQFDSVCPVTVRMVDGYLEAERDPVQHRRFVEFLIGLGADPALADNEGRVPLFLATNELLLPLLGRGAALEARDKEGLTPFLKATPALALALMQLDADLHAVDAQGRSRWFHLRGKGWEELALQLLKRGVSIARQDNKGQTALMAYCANQDLPQARFLIAHGADCVMADKKGHTPLHLAAEQHNPELLALLLQQGAAVNARDDDGETPLFAACRHRGCVELLMGNGADAAIPNRQGQNVLHLLAANNREREMEMLVFFIARGVPVNHKDRSNWNPLIVAYESSNIPAMKRLLENGADPNVVHYSDWSLLDRAEQDKKQEVIELLRHHGARHARSWVNRHQSLLYYLALGFGIFPLFTLVFGLLKPSCFMKSVRRVVPIAIAALALCLLAVLVIGGVTRESDYVPLFLIFAIPLLAVLLISLAGIQTLAERVSPSLGIPLSILNAAGCPALTMGISWLISSGFKGEGGMALGYFLFLGGGTAIVISLIYAIIIWRKRLAPVKNAGSPPQS
jgi:ankyrin repeat protein